MKMRQASALLRQSAAFLAAWLLCCCGTELRPGDEVVARVGDGVVTRAQLELEQARTRAVEGGKTPLEALVERERLAQAARRAGLEADPLVRAELEAACREILARAWLERELAAAGSEEVLRDRYEEQRQALSRTVVHVRQIAFRAGPGDADARARARARATTVYAELKAGASFAELAAQHSEHRVSATRGGDMGELREGTIDKGFFDQVRELQPNQPTPPFETAYGFHIVEAVQPPRTEAPSFADARPALRAELRSRVQAEIEQRLSREIPVKLIGDAAAKEHRR